MLTIMDVRAAQEGVGIWIIIELVLTGTYLVHLMTAANSQ